MPQIQFATAVNMEPESVLIIATVFVLINTGVILCSELFRESTADNVLRDTFARSTFTLFLPFLWIHVTSRAF